MREKLSRGLRELGVEEKAGPGRTDGFTALTFQGKQFAHFHHDHEIDIRLGKATIERERLVHPATSTVHPRRAKGSPWYEMKIVTGADVDEVLRLVRMVIREIGSKR